LKEVHFDYPSGKFRGVTKLKPKESYILNFRIIGTDLPGMKFARSQGALVDREPIFLGVQKQNEVIDRVRGDASCAVFNFQIEVSSKAGELDFRGPFVHGRKGDRFLYLSWEEQGKDGSFTMFRRVKLPLSAINAKDLKRSLFSGSPKLVEAKVELTGEDHGPLCGTVAEKSISWGIHDARN
jgi:Family of unknown function (DUF5990)